MLSFDAFNESIEEKAKTAKEAEKRTKEFEEMKKYFESLKRKEVSGDQQLQRSMEQMLKLMPYVEDMGIELLREKIQRYNKKNLQLETTTRTQQ